VQALDFEDVSNNFSLFIGFPSKKALARVLLPTPVVPMKDMVTGIFLALNGSIVF